LCVGPERVFKGKQTPMRSQRSPKSANRADSKGSDLLKQVLGVWVDAQRSTYEVELDENSTTSCTVRTLRPNGQKLVTRGLITVCGSSSKSKVFSQGSVLWARSYTLDETSISRQEIRWVHRSHGKDFTWRRKRTERPRRPHRSQAWQVKAIEDLLEEEQSTEDDGWSSKSSTENHTDGDGCLAAIVDRQVKSPSAASTQVIASTKTTSAPTTPTLFEALKAPGLRTWSSTGCVYGNPAPEALPAKLSLNDFVDRSRADAGNTGVMSSQIVASSPVTTSRVCISYPPGNFQSSMPWSSLRAEAPSFVPDYWHSDMPFCPLAFAQAHAHCMNSPDFMYSDQPSWEYPEGA